ncbi:unnamed protein product [Orchesella dallaii]|uniref:Uncharacterized protein n=1 Tax=Orchesella dallaii TaxID=48710 RepID=A0ABP1RGZ9_9HEXA
MKLPDLECYFCKICCCLKCNENIYIISGKRLCDRCAVKAIYPKRILKPHILLNFLASGPTSWSEKELREIWLSETQKKIPFSVRKLYHPSGFSNFFRKIDWRFRHE